MKPRTGSLRGPDPTSPLAHRSRRPAWLVNWLARHQHPVSFWLHVVGIPMAVACIPLAVVQLARGEWHLWWRPAALLAGGYFLQWIGHRIEGNDMGEMILVKRMLGKPYKAISPRYLHDGSPSSPVCREEKNGGRNA